MVTKSRVKKSFEIFLVVFALIYSLFSLQAQNKLDRDFKINANIWYDIEYQVPKNYYGIVVETSYLPNGKNLQSGIFHGIKYKKHNIIVAFSFLKSLPTTTPRGKRIREVSGDPGRINLGAIAFEADTTLSKIKYLDTLQLKKVNADNGVIYNLKISNKYMKIYARCKKIILYKSEWGSTEILFFYNKKDDALVDKEIEKTWGMLKFK